MLLSFLTSDVFADHSGESADEDEYSDHPDRDESCHCFAPIPVSRALAGM